jgi:hypothetical protein
MATSTTYATYKFTVKTQSYTVIHAFGAHNYVTIVKDYSAKVFGTPGKQFKSFDHAIESYKNATIKIELLKIQAGITAATI